MALWCRGGAVHGIITGSPASLGPNEIARTECDSGTRLAGYPATGFCWGCVRSALVGWLLILRSQWSFLQLRGRYLRRIGRHGGRRSRRRHRPVAMGSIIERRSAFRPTSGSPASNGVDLELLRRYSLER